jgi:rhamnosyl/mannosyltransferase
LRIVHVYKDYHPPTRGGIEQTIQTAANEQARQGHDVTVLVSAGGKRRSSHERLDGVSVVRVAEWARLLSSPICPGFPRELGRSRADVWHLHWPNPLGEVSWLLRRPPGALVVSYHSDVVRQKLAQALYRPLARRLLERADLLLPTSDRYVEFSPFLRSFRERCRVVPSGIDLAPFEGLDRNSAAAVQLRARYGGPFVLFVGRLRYYKGVDILLRAMVEVNGRAVIVGDGPMRPGLEALHAELELGDRVRFTGTIDDSALALHLAAADVGVLPSTHPSEALGLALVEYLAAGIPAICTELGTGTTFVNQDGETGLVVPPGDHPALAAALRTLLADEGLRHRLGAAGRERARRVFSREAMVRGYLAAYREAIERRSRGGSAHLVAEPTTRG